MDERHGLLAKCPRDNDAEVVVVLRACMPALVDVHEQCRVLVQMRLQYLTFAVTEAITPRLPAVLPKAETSMSKLTSCCRALRDACKMPESSTMPRRLLSSVRACQPWCMCVSSVAYMSRRV